MKSDVSFAAPCPLLHSPTSKSLLKRKASGVFAQAEFQLTQRIVIIPHNDQQWPVQYTEPKRTIFINWKHLLLLLYLADICKEGGFVILELKVLGGDTVIAKDVDSKRQLTEPLKSFIYAPQPAGRKRGRERERGRAECTTPKAALKSSRLTSSLSPGTTVIVSEWLLRQSLIHSLLLHKKKKKYAAWWSSSLKLRSNCTK